MPPLEAKKMLFSLAVTEGIGFKDTNKKKGMKIDFIDIRKAYFQAAAVRDVYVELPEEDYEEGMCGKLIKSMYGTRDAACLLYTSPSPRDQRGSRMPSSA